MRPRFELSLLLIALAGCQCGPKVATPVTLVVKNASGSAIWVDDTTSNLGLEVQHNVGGSFQTFKEAVDCPCEACDQVCNGCTCNPTPPPMVERIDPGMSVQRIWTGFVQQQGQGSCGAIIQGPTCYSPGIPTLNEVLNLHLCYAPSAAGVPLTDAGVPVSGSILPPNELCTDKQFRVEDGTVEIGPVPGSACNQTSDCKNPGELCFGGQCTTACPANAIPPVGGSWQVSVGTTNQGLLNVSTDGQGHVISAGTGVVTAASYSAGTLSLTLGPGDGGLSNAIVYVTLPAAYAEPFTVGQQVAAFVVDATGSSTPGNIAAVLRDGAGNLLLVADPAELTPVLSAAQIAPFSVAGTSTIVGCDVDPCGKLLHYATAFDAGAGAAAVAGGQAQVVVVAGRAYQVLNVANDAYTAATACALGKLMPYAILYMP